MFEEELANIDKDHLRRHPTVLEPSQGPYVTLNGRKLLLMCSNDYLGLAGHRALAAAAHAAIRKYGFGAGASRLVSGTGPLHRELEERLAVFKGTEAALVFNSGYAANTGIIPAVVGEGDIILSDALNHASIVDGCRLSRARIAVYRHCDVNHVEEILQRNSSMGKKLIVTDGVFSMDGDIAPLISLVSLAERYHALLMVDDAHATGVLGKSGKGTPEHLGISSGRIPIQMGTLGKALGSFGAYVAGSRDLIDYLVNRSRSFMFSTALPPAVCAASIAALDIVEHEPERRDILRKNRDRFARGLASLGITAGATETPIIPLVIGNPEKALGAGERLLEYGVYATAIRPPSVPEGTARIRSTLLASHSDKDLDRALAAFDRIRREGYL